MKDLLKKRKGMVIKMKKAILCVDDEKIIILSLLEQLKERFGNKYIYESAMSEEEALLVIDELVCEQINVILVISDWLMEGVKGDEFLIKVKEMYPGTLNIILTGQASSDAIENVEKEGVLSAFMAKPWNEEGLMNKISSLLGEFDE